MTMLQHKRGVDYLYMVYYKFAWSRRKLSIKNFCGKVVEKFLGGRDGQKKFCGKMVKRRYDKDIGKKVNEVGYQ